MMTPWAEARMLSKRVDLEWSDQDRLIFEALVPVSHRLRQIAARIDFESFHDVLAPYYHASMGRPGDGVLLVKVLFLQYFYTLSDRQVIERLQSDAAFRWFVGLSLLDNPPDSSTLTYFRSRLGVEGTTAVMDSLIRLARHYGLLKHRLRLKDATHVVANVAIRATLPLLAEVREKILSAARPFAEEDAAASEARLVEVRAATKGCDDAVRLASRVGLLQDILVWARRITRPEGADETAWMKFEHARELLEKMLEDAAHPEAGDRLRSAHDPDVRRGKHGQFYDGYLVDILMDSDSELITSINVLPANGYEGADAIALIRHEESVTGENVQAMSIDGAGHAGEVLRELQDPDGLALDMYVPPQASSAPKHLFASTEFIEDAAHHTLTCPAGHSSHSLRRDEGRHGRVYTFSKATCSGCPLLERCMDHAPQRQGRTVRKSDYEQEYQAVRDKAATPEYEAVKKEHPKVERKLSEMVNRHGARRARYRGLAKVLCQQLWIAIAVNVKRMTKLLSPIAVRPLQAAID